MDETLFSDPGEDTQVVAPTQVPTQTPPIFPATQPQGQQSPAQPQSAPYQPHNVFGKIFEILGGGPKYSYKANPDTGEMVKTDVTTKGDLAKSIVAGALTGLFSGAQYHGPGAGLHSLGLGGEAAANMASKRDAEARQRAIDDAKNQQEAQLRKAQIFNVNAEAIHNVRNAEKLQGDILDDVVARDSAQLSEIPDDGIISKSVPQDEALAKLKSGELNAGKVLFLVDGKTVQKDANGNDVIDPRTGERKMEATVTIVNNVPVALSKDDAARYAAARIPGFTNGAAPAEGTRIPLATKRAWDNQVHNVEIARGIAKDVGSVEEFQKALDTPGAAAALKDFSRFAGLHDPYAAMKQMETMKNKDGSPVYSPRVLGILSDMFGAGKAKDYHDKIEAQAAAQKTGQETTARQQAELANPTTAAQAQASVAAAESAARANPTKENLTVLFNAQNKYRTFAALENQQKYAQAREAEKARYDELDVQNQKDLPALMPGIRNYQVDPQKLEGLRGGARKAFMAAVLAQDPSWNEATYKARYKTQQDFAPGGKEGQQIVSLNTFLGHSADAYQVIDAANNIYPGGANKSINWLMKNTKGSPAVVALKTDLMLAKEEAENFFKAGHAPLKEEVEAMNKIADENSTPNDIRAALNTLSGLALVRGNSLNASYKSQMGGKNIPDMFNPQAMKSAVLLGHGEEMQRLTGMAAVKDKSGKIIGFAPVGSKPGDSFTPVD